MSIPHFALPLQYVNGHAVVNEQDTMDDIASCVQAICLTQPGDRDELPEFGLEDLTFTQQPISSDALIAQIQNFEPRATILADVAPDKLDAAIVNAELDIVVSQ